MQIGFIGLGNMGRPMAANLVRKGCDLRVYDVRREPMQALEALGAKPVADLRGIAGFCDVVFTMLPDSAAVEEVFRGPAASSRTANQARRSST